MSSVIEQAIRQICEEKGLEYDSVLETIEAALAAAYRKDYGDRYHNLEAEFDPETGGVRVFDVKSVVDDISQEEIEAMEVREAEKAAKREAARAIGENIPEEVLTGDEAAAFNPKTDIMVSQAKILKSSAKVGDVLRTEMPQPGEFGRMAAMTAKQVITQKLREAEREIVFNEYKGHEGEVLVGTVQRREGRIVLVDIGRTAGILKAEDQMQNERYNSGDRMKVYVREVSLGSRGPQILLSRTHEGLVRKLFDIEIPEVAEGQVEIRSLAREAGARTKLPSVPTTRPSTRLAHVLASVVRAFRRLFRSSLARRLTSSSGARTQRTLFATHLRRQRLSALRSTKTNVPQRPWLPQTSCRSPLVVVDRTYALPQNSRVGS